MTLEVNNVVKRFYDKKRGEFAAVDNISFSCAPGEVMGLLGPNGAGKTTTLRMIGTLLSPDSGNITLDGFDTVLAPEAVRTRLGFLSTDTGLYEKLTPREILVYFARLSKYPSDKIESRIEELITFLDIKKYADVRCEKLSTGMRQKVSFARSIVHDPPTMAFDEPANGLDVIAIRALHQFIKTCKEQRKCVVLSTHVMSEAEKLCDRIAIIHKGRIFAIGTLEELRAKSGEHYLEEIFFAIVQETVDELL
jgi:sodium transport system ATP-binding protein